MSDFDDSDAFQAVSSPVPLSQRAMGARATPYLDGLNAAQREAVLLHYFHQFTVKEIAQMTNTPLPTVKSRLRAARSTLSDDLWEDFS